MRLSAMMLTGEAPCFSILQPHAALKEALAVMVKENKSAVVVMRGVRPSGIVTRTDVLRALDRPAGKAGEALTLEQIMTRELVVGGPDNTCEEVLGRMTRFRIQHLPVIEEGRFLTVVHERNLLRSRLKMLHEDINHLREYIEGLHNAEQD